MKQFELEFPDRITMRYTSWQEAKQWAVRQMTSEIKEAYIYSLNSEGSRDERIFSILPCAGICPQCQSACMKVLFIPDDGHLPLCGCKDCTSFFTLSETERDRIRKFNT